MFGIGEPIVGKFQVALHLDEAHSAQIREMPGNSRLRKAEYLYYVADTQLPRGEKAQNADSRRICESLEHPVEVLDGSLSDGHSFLRAFRQAPPQSHIRHSVYNMATRI